MSKSIKFTNDTYLDSSGIVHNKTTLKNKFQNAYKEILKEKGAGATITGTLTESYDNFDMLLITWSPYSYTGNIRTMLIPVSTINITTSDKLTYEDTDYQTNSVSKNIIFGFTSKTTIVLKCANTSTWGSSTTKLISIKGIKLT